MKITTVVLTGGPCAGKSKSKDFIMEKLQERGYKVIAIDEAATKLILNGINPSDELPLLEFQKYVAREQLHNEKEAKKAAEEFIKRGKYKGVVILCDRGMADQLGYVSKDELYSIVEECGYSRNAVYDYDCIIHMVTAADGAREHYRWAGSEDLEGVNLARRETPDEAVEKDKITQQAWTGSQHFKVIDNSTDFTKKKLRVFNEICAVLGEPVPLEKERKFLIHKPTEKDLSRLGYTSVSKIIQTYLKDDGAVERRVRMRGTEKDGYVFYYTEKKEVGVGVREEDESRISMEDYVRLLTEADTSLQPIHKTRYCFLYNQRHFELDIYPFSDDYAVLEIEVTDFDEPIDMPELDIIKEVTSDNRYRNHTLARTMKIEP